jgi:hypothetical protein
LLFVVVILILHTLGTVYSKPIHISDWYATFCAIGGGSLCTGPGADPTGEQVKGIVPVESVNVWPFIVENRTADVPHPLLQLSPNALIQDDGVSRFKLLTG